MLLAVRWSLQSTEAAGFVCANLLASRRRIRIMFLTRIGPAPLGVGGSKLFARLKMNV